MRIEKPLLLLAAVTFPFAIVAPAASSEPNPTNSEAKSVTYALELARDEERVVLAGEVVRQLDDDLFILSDGTADIRIDTWVEGKGAVTLPIGTPIQLTGLVDRHPLRRTEVYLVSFDELPQADKGSAKDSASAPGTSADAAGERHDHEVTHDSIRELRKDTRDGERVVFLATVDRPRGDDAYILEDETGTVRLDAWVSGLGSVELPVGETVLVHGHVDKHWLMPTEVYLHSFTLLE